MHLSLFFVRISRGFPTAAAAAAAAAVVAHDLLGKLDVLHHLDRPVACRVLLPVLHNFALEDLVQPLHVLHLPFRHCSSTAIGIGVGVGVGGAAANWRTRKRLGRGVGRGHRRVQRENRSTTVPTVLVVVVAVTRAKD